MNQWVWSIGGIRLTGDKRRPREKHLVLFPPPQIPHELTWYRTRSQKMSVPRLKPEPCHNLEIFEIEYEVWYLQTDKTLTYAAGSFWKKWLSLTWWRNSFFYGAGGWQPGSEQPINGPHTKSFTLYPFIHALLVLAYESVVLYFLRLCWPSVCFCSVTRELRGIEMPGTIDRMT